MTLKAPVRIEEIPQWMADNIVINSKDYGLIPLRFEDIPGCPVSFKWQGDVVNDFFVEYKARDYKLVSLKVRQCGSTTLYIAMAYALSAKLPGYSGRIFFQDDKTAEERKRDIFDPMYNNTPPEERPKAFINNKRQIMFENGSIITFDFFPSDLRQIKEGFGRSGTSQYVIITEAGFYKVGKEAFAALRSSLATHAWIVVESTPKFYGWFRDMSDKSREGELEGWKYLFLGRDELYGSEAGKRHIAAYIAENGEEEARHEYPENPFDCWVAMGGRFFDARVVARMKSISKQTQFDIHTIDLSQQAAYPDPHGHLKILRPIDAADNGAERDEGGYPQRRAYGDKEDRRYVIPVDVGYGVGADYSVAYVKDFETRRTVAQLRTNKIPPVEFADYCMVLGKWYNWALIASEVNKKDLGGAFLDRLREREYRRIYTRKKWEDKFQRFVPKYGWLTDGVSRPRMLGHLQHLVNNEMTGNAFSEFWEEADHFHIIDGRPEAEEDRHDDCIMTEGIGSFVCANHDWYSKALKPEKVTFGRSDPRRYFEKAGANKEALSNLGNG